MEEEEMQESAERTFKSYRRPIVTVTYLKYLGWVLKVVDYDWTAVVGNLWKEQKSWAHLARILARAGASPHISGIFFKVVVQAVLLFGLEVWVMILRMGRSLGSFQNRVARRITGSQPKKR